MNILETPWLVQKQGEKIVDSNIQHGFLLHPYWIPICLRYLVHVYLILSRTLSCTSKLLCNHDMILVAQSKRIHPQKIKLGFSQVAVTFDKKQNSQTKVISYLYISAYQYTMDWLMGSKLILDSQVSLSPLVVSVSYFFLHFCISVYSYLLYQYPVSVSMLHSYQRAVITSIHYQTNKNQPTEHCAKPRVPAQSYRITRKHTRFR